MIEMATLLWLVNETFRTILDVVLFSLAHKDRTGQNPIGFVCLYWATWGENSI